MYISIILMCCKLTSNCRNSKIVLPLSLCLVVRLELSWGPEPDCVPLFEDPCSVVQVCPILLLKGQSLAPTCPKHTCLHVSRAQSQMAHFMCTCCLEDLQWVPPLRPLCALDAHFCWDCTKVLPDSQNSIMLQKWGLRGSVQGFRVPFGIEPEVSSKQTCTRQSKQHYVMKVWTWRKSARV